MSLPRVHVTVEGTHEMSVFEMADAFCEMDSDQQALFFETVYNITESWEHNRTFQWQYIRDSIDKHQYRKALTILRELGECAE